MNSDNKEAINLLLSHSKIDVNMATRDGYKQVNISMPIEKWKEFKLLAVQHDMTLSQLLTTAATITSIEDIKNERNKKNS